MIKYAKIIDEIKGICEVGLGSDEKFYESLGMVKLDVEKSDANGEWYLTEKLHDEKYLQEQAEIQKQKRIDEIKAQLNELDIKTIRALREGGDDDNGRPFIEVYQELINTLRDELDTLEN